MDLNFFFSLISGGHIYYLGKDSLALLGLIDASECPPTYGASKVNFVLMYFNCSMSYNYYIRRPNMLMSSRPTYQNRIKKFKKTSNILRL